MSVSITTGIGSLINLGLSVSDIALIVDHGKKFGNFLRVRENDGDLFATIGETPEAILKRRGLVEVAEMGKRWPVMRFIYRGTQRQNDTTVKTSHAQQQQAGNRGKSESVDAFTWVMVAIIAALEDCLPMAATKELLIRTFKNILNGDENTENALRVQLDVNIESWRSFGCTRDISLSIKRKIRRSLQHIWGTDSDVLAVSQLNEAETNDMERFLVWLLSGDNRKLYAMSAITHAVAQGLQFAKLDICTDGELQHEGQACVVYQPGGSTIGQMEPQIETIRRGLSFDSLQIAWPRNQPNTMIHALRSISNYFVISRMAEFWKRGSDAAKELKMVAKADLPYEETREVYYSVQAHESRSGATRSFLPHVTILANQGFPADTQLIYVALENLMQGLSSEQITWLQTHTANEYLLRIEKARSMPEVANIDLLLVYQALMFGFYYQLLDQLLCFKLVEKEAYFHGLWGSGSTTFLAMCTQFSKCLRDANRASRAHTLYMISAMYNGRRKVFQTSMSNPRLVGILGPISVVALPLVRTTDVPKDIWKLAIIDLPIVDFVPVGSDGELMAGDGGGLQFVPATEFGKAEFAIRPDIPSKKWTVHPCMNILFGGEQSDGVVMAARCGGRLVGWFNPVAADFAFLSLAYVQDSRYEHSGCDRAPGAFEVDDEQWQAGKVRQPVSGQKGFQFGIIQSRSCPELRYAAAGFYNESREEISISGSDDQFSSAFERLELQESGVVIS